MASPQRLRLKVKEGEKDSHSLDELVKLLSDDNKRLRAKVKKIRRLLPKASLGDVSEEEEGDSLPSSFRSKEDSSSAGKEKDGADDTDPAKKTSLPSININTTTAGGGAATSGNKKKVTHQLKSLQDFENLNKIGAPPLAIWYGRETCGRCVAFKSAWETLMMQQPKAEYAQIDCSKKNFYIDLGISGSIGLPLLVFYNEGERFKTIQPTQGWTPDSYARQAASIIQQMLIEGAAANDGGGNPLSARGGGAGGRTQSSLLGGTMDSLRQSSTLGGGGKNPLFTLPSRSGQTNALIKECLLEHNKYRMEHGVAPLQWDEHCYTTAKKWAETMAKENKMYHGGHKGMGQNLAYCSAGLTFSRSVQMWYDEVKLYDFKKPTFSMATGHFTQVVWKGTAHVGMAVCKAKNGATYICANYSQPGNVMGRFAENVFPKGGVPPSGQMPKLPERRQESTLGSGDFSREPSSMSDGGSGRTMSEDELIKKLQSMHRGRMERERSKDIMMGLFGGDDDDGDEKDTAPVSARVKNEKSAAVKKVSCGGGLKPPFPQDLEVRCLEGPPR